jgi:hypothetical protein
VGFNSGEPRLIDPACRERQKASKDNDLIAVLPVPVVGARPVQGLPGFAVFEST